MDDIAQIQAIIARCCGLQPNACTPDTTLYELGIDSVGVASIISDCELILSKNFDESTIIKIMSASTVARLTEALLAPATRD